MIGCLAVAGYRSLRDLRVPLGRLTVVTGQNGSGKSSLYRALRLLADIGQGRVIGSLAAGRCQMIVVSHAATLVDRLTAEPDCQRVALEKRHGETTADAIEAPRWAWPTR